MVLSKPFIIADIGSTWKRGASREENALFALRAIDSAARAKVDAVKFQLYSHKDLYGFDGENPYELPTEWLANLRVRAEDLKLEFMCTVFNAERVSEINDLVRIHKIASSNMKDVDLIDAIAQTGKPVIVSTGSSHYLEIQWLINLWPEISPAPLCILDCVGAYPAQERDYHLQMLSQIASHTGSIGVSDHTLSNIVALSSIGYGATVFEKHFDAFKDMGMCQVPDSAVAISESEMTKYVNDIHLGMLACEKALRRPSRAEDEFQTMHRRRIIALKDLKIGDKLLKNVNYGAFRTKKPDFRGAPMENINFFHEKTINAEIPAFHGIASSDILK